MNELSLEEVVEEFFWSINHYESYGDRDDLLALIYLVHTMGYQRGFLDATKESNKVYAPNVKNNPKP